MGNRIAAGAICCTLIARRSAGVVLLDCALAEPVTPNRVATMVMAVMPRKRRRLLLISSSIDLSPIGKQSSPQTLSRHIPGGEKIFGNSHRSGFDQVSHNADVASGGFSIRTSFMRAVHQGLGDFALQTRQADVEASLEEVSAASCAQVHFGVNG